MDVESCVPPTYVFCLGAMLVLANERAECADRDVPEHHLNLSLTFSDGCLFQLPPSKKECNLLKVKQFSSLIKSISILSIIYLY